MEILSLKLQKRNSKRPYFRGGFGRPVGPPKHALQRPGAPKTPSKMGSNLDPKKQFIGAKLASVLAPS